MKAAAIKDSWRNLSRVVDVAKGIVKIEQLTGSNACSLMPDGIFAVVGLNGSGKSSFFEYLTERSYNRLPFLAHEVHLYGKGVLTIPGDVIPAIIVDPISELKRSNKLINEFRSTFDQGELIIVKDDDRGLLNYVIGSYYTNIWIEEIQVSENEVCPRFVVSIKDLKIDNEYLSLGEQTVLYIFWVLTKKYNSPGVYFIEEPESGLSPAAQLRLVDLLVYISSDKKKQLFLSTHSPFIVSRLGSDRVLLMKKDASAKWVNGKQSNYLEELGMDLGRHGIIYVEDNKAKIFLQKIFDIYGSDLRKTFDIVYLGGESHVYEVVSRIANNEQHLKIFGILDADERNCEKYKKYADHFFFLPGLLAPEEELIKAIYSNISEYARQLTVNQDRLKDVLRQVRSVNHHDFFEELSRRLYGDVRSFVYEIAFTVWFHSYPDREEVHALIRKIDPHLPQQNIDDVDADYPCRHASVVQVE
jgi:ABC-type multidrug transport system ATPase subunit